MFIYLFILERGREKERETSMWKRNINRLPLIRTPGLGTEPATQASALTWSQSATIHFAERCPTPEPHWLVWYSVNSLMLLSVEPLLFCLYPYPTFPWLYHGKIDIKTNHFKENNSAVLSTFTMLCTAIATIHLQSFPPSQNESLLPSSNSPFPPLCSPAASTLLPISITVTILGTQFIWNHTALVILCLACFTRHHVFKVHHIVSRVRISLPLKDENYLTQFNHTINNSKMCPSWCDSVNCALACRQKGRWFNSQSGHLPGLWARSQLGVWERQLIDVSFPLFLFPFPLSKNK